LVTFLDEVDLAAQVLAEPGKNILNIFT
jgi:hypothetical protein